MDAFLVDHDELPGRDLAFVLGADEEQLVAASRTVAEVQEQIGATSLAYISLEGVQAATMRPENEFCRACFTRTYPTRVPAGKTLAKFRFEPSTA